MEFKKWWDRRLEARGPVDDVRSECEVTYAISRMHLRVELEARLAAVLGVLETQSRTLGLTEYDRGQITALRSARDMLKNRVVS